MVDILKELYDTFMSNSNIIGYIFDTLIIATIVLFIIKLVKSDIRLFHILKVFIIILVAYILAGLFNAALAIYLLEKLFTILFIIYIIILAPEIRNYLHALGEKITIKRQEKFSESSSVQELLQAIQTLSERRIGAIITIERSRKLDEFIQKATILDAKITKELLLSIFVTSAPLHDGAVILRGDKIACAAAFYTPSSSTQVPKHCGSRHRAAVGVSEVSDALTFIVSEETGSVSIAITGKLEYGATEGVIKDYLVKYLDM